MTTPYNYADSSVTEMIDFFDTREEKKKSSAAAKKSNKKSLKKHKHEDSDPIVIESNDLC